MGEQFSGMDVAQIRSMAARMRSEAGEIDASIQRLTTSLQAAPWRGADRERFLDEWQSRHMAALRRVADGLQEAAERANEYASRQEWASRS